MAAEDQQSEWTEAETWAWHQLRHGKVADFNQRDGKLSPATSEGWTVEREVRPAFLEALLLADKYRLVLPRPGLCIAGAWIHEPLLLDHATLIHQCRIEFSRIESAVNLSQIRSTDDVSFRGSWLVSGVSMKGSRVDAGVDLSDAVLSGTLDMRGLDVSADLMLNRIHCQTVRLSRARVGGVVELLAATCTGTLDMEGLQAHFDVFMGRGSKYETVEFNGATIGGQLSAVNASFGRLEIEGIEVRADFNLNSATVDTVESTGAVVGGQFNLSGANCTGEACLQGVQIATDLLGHESAFGALDLRGARIAGGIDLGQIHCKALLSMDGAQIGTDLTVSKGSTLGSLDLKGARIAGAMSIDHTTCEGAMRMAGLQVGASIDLLEIQVGKTIHLNRLKCHGGLSLLKSKIAKVELRYAVIGGVVNMSGTSMNGDLDMERLEVGGNLFLRDKARFQQIYLWDANIKGIIQTKDAEFEKSLDMSGVHAGLIQVLTGSWIRDGVKAPFAKIDQNLELGGGELDGGADLDGRVDLDGTLDFVGAEIGGALILGWDKGILALGTRSALILHDVSAGTVQMHLRDDCRPVWPSRCDLSGFTYRRIGAPALSTSAGAHSDHSAHALIEWLATDESSSAQPYQQLARVLAEQGEAAKSETVLYAGRERQRRRSRGFRRVGFELLRWTIGYGIGYRYFRSLAYAAILGIIGAFIFGSAVRQHWTGVGAPMLFSLDQLLPIISVAPGADDIAKTIRGWQHVYLAVHRTLGFLLGSFVIAGLSGIAKK